MSTDPELLLLRVRLEGGREVEVDAKRLAGAVGDIGDEATRSAAKTSAASRRMTGAMGAIASHGRKLRQTGQSMTLGMTLPLVGLGTIAVKSAANFERSMAQVQVATGAGNRQMRGLTKTAETLGAVTKFSAGEAAEGMLELAKSGMTPAQIRGGALKASMDLAAAGNIALAQSATLTGTSMNAFNLRASRAKKISDALAGGANRSAADVADLSLALSQGGTSAAAYRLSINESVGALAAFADNAISGSDAGTSFKVFLSRLNPVTAKAKELMNEYGLSFFDAHGHMKKLPAVAAQLRSKLGGLSDKGRGAVLGSLFGTDAIRAANVFYKEGAKGIRGYIRATEKQGSASKMANAFMRGTAGTLEKASGAMENAKLALGRALAPAVIMLADAVANLSDWFSSLPKPVQKFMVAGLGVLAVAGPLLVFLGAAATGVSVLGAALAFVAANPVVLIIAGLVAVGAGLVVAYQKVGWFRNAVDATFSWIKGHWPLLVAILIGPVAVAAYFVIKHWGAIKGAVGGAVDFIGDKIGDAVGFFQSLPSRAVGALGAFVDQLGQWGEAAGVAFVNALISMVNEGIGAINSTLDDANALSILGVDAPNLPEVGGIATGGSPSGRKAPGGRRSLGPKAPPRAKRTSRGPNRERPITLMLPDMTVLATGVLKEAEDVAALS